MTNAELIAHLQKRDPNEKAVLVVIDHESGDPMPEEEDIDILDLEDEEVASMVEEGMLDQKDAGKLCLHTYGR